MQKVAVEAVERFSDVSGLRLNVLKSMAIHLGSRGSTEERSTEDDTQSTVQMILRTKEARYLGHYTGEGDTMRTAWDRAFKALSVRLSLAQRKTNTVHQRAKLASAIIIPKLLYVGRHAWPSQDVVTEADNRIKNFIWRSSFARTDRAPAGWVGAAIAGLPNNLGGLVILCIKTKLMALGAHTVGKWVLAENPLTQMIGDILQLPHGLHNRAIVPRHCKIPCKLRKSIWETGRPWTELHWAQDNPHDEEQEGAEQSLRRLLKLRHGLRTTWQADGLSCNFNSRLNEQFQDRTRKRTANRGKFSYRSSLSRQYGSGQQPETGRHGRPAQAFKHGRQ
ncbi:hypothetical protein PI125_g7223 [Phytophthora idaei]|nr:hypothetical protein PI125_g7223 [Phytophthora idaei]